MRARAESLLALALATLIGVTTLLVAPVAYADPLSVRVRGSAKLAVRTTRDQPAPGVSELVFTGTLTDDAGDPLGLQTITIEISRESNPQDESTARGLHEARACDSAGADHPSAWGVRAGGANEVVVVTDDSGRFCFRARVDPDRYNAHVTYRPQARAFVDGVTDDIKFDLSRRGLTLRFDPTPKIIALDTTSTSLEAVAVVDDGGSSRVEPGLTVVLSNETGELGRQLTDASGRARFSLPTSRLGPPGRGQLRLAFAGDSQTTAAAYTEEIERHVSVRMTPKTGDGGDVTVPEDGVPLEVQVDSRAGNVASGAVEARIGDTVVGVAGVEHGMARLTLTFSSRGSEALVGLRYVPASPWYEAAGDVPVRLRIKGPSPFSKVPLLVAGLAMVAFFLAGRISGQKTKVEPIVASEDAARERDAKPGIALVRQAGRDQKGWSGRVSDAHEGSPVRDARVWIERGTFQGRAILASTATDEQGRFSLQDVGPRAGDERLAVEARFHSRVVQDLPASGELAIAISARRRAILAKLVTWARRKGAPFDAKPEPTPGHVRSVAVGDVDTTRWANAVEGAVFGPGEIDARTEQELDQLGPLGDGPKHDPS